MPTFTPTVLTDAHIIINSVVWSTHANKVEIPFKADVKDATTFGQTWRVKRAGLKEGNFNAEFLTDYTAANLDELLWTIFNAGTNVTFEVRPTSAARSATNPAFTGSVVPVGWIPVTGNVGELVAVAISWETSGTVSRLVA